MLLLLFECCKEIKNIFVTALCFYAKCLYYCSNLQGLLNLLKFSPKWLKIALLFYIHNYRAGNSLIGFLSELFVFCKKMSKWVIGSKKWVIRSFSHALIFGEWPERITNGHLFLVSDLSDSLSSLSFGEQPERFAHIAHQKEGMSKSLIFFLLQKRA